jgi:hypothetical protein
VTTILPYVAPLLGPIAIVAEKITSYGQKAVSFVRSIANGDFIGGLAGSLAESIKNSPVGRGFQNLSNKIGGYYDSAKKTYNNIIHKIKDSRVYKFVEDVSNRVYS